MKKKPNPLRTEAAIRKAMKGINNMDGVTADWEFSGTTDLILFFYYVDSKERIAELSVNDYLKKAPVKRGMKAVLKTLRKRK